jgi:uncharacterized protein (DUF1800 family)
MRKPFITAAVAACLVASSPGLFHSITSTAASFPNDDRTITHVLNRIGFGPREGDVARVRKIGLQRHIEQQLRPEHIADQEIAGRLEGLTTLGLSADDIAQRFEIPVLRARRERRMQSEKGTEQDRQRRPVPEMQRANQLVLELSEQKLLRAIYSERQLQEVLTDFWFNHFNVDARKGRSRFTLTAYERDAIRPHVFGSFRDLLGATAKSPAMLFYLDNWMSADPNSRPFDPLAMGGRFGRGGFGGSALVPGAANGQGNRAPRGLNENYGRELMELHTLGVDGGYTQKDVTEVARAFTGWTIENPLHGGGFRFEPRIHDDGEKVVLGQHIKAGGGQRDGELVLDILAGHQSTAHFIATKLVRRFVSDTPPAPLVDRAAKRFRQTDGDLREVMRTILTSPEFLSPETYRAKVKTPFEFLVSAVRATGADVQDAQPLVRRMQQLGMPLYQCQPPTGYKDTADAWVNAGALVNRMNAALELASGRIRGISIEHAAIFGAADPSSELEHSRARLVEATLGNDISDSTRTTIAKAETVAQMVALTLGSPEFQRR